ncbi:MAG: methionyl-tRNA formyltransferase [Candidatus Glassbacteria bacterium]|nr:methionyl-tRNA formyltransferase [Candidatus Glassbacteria bacterium]
MRVLFWGSPEFAVVPLEALFSSAHRVVGVVCQPDRPGGRGRRLRPPAVKTAAGPRGVVVLQPELPRGREFLARIESLEADISVVAAYGHILRPEVLEVPPHGSINLHASLLPAYRGAAPVQRAVLAGETTTGITVIRMDEGMDTGDMLARRELTVLPGESAGELSVRLSSLAAELMLEVLEAVENNTLEPVPQPAEGVSYAPKVKHGEARLDWSRPAGEVACRIRAFDPAPGAFCFYRGAMLKLFHPLPGEETALRPGEVAAAGEQGVAVCCGDGRAVLVRQLQAPGKRRMTAAEFLRGARLAAGEILE